MHVTLVVLLPTFAWLTWWQLERATSGNSISWAYTFEWPLFGGYAIYVWWQLIHDTPTVFNRGRTDVAGGEGGTTIDPHDVPGWALESGRHRKDPKKQAPVAGPDVAVPEQARENPEEENPELAEYNRYLAELAEADRKQ